MSTLALFRVQGVALSVLQCCHSPSLFGGKQIRPAVSRTSCVNVHSQNAIVYILEVVELRDKVSLHTGASFGPISVSVAGSSCVAGWEYRLLDSNKMRLQYCPLGVSYLSDIESRNSFLTGERG